VPRWTSALLVALLTLTACSVGRQVEGQQVKKSQPAPPPVSTGTAPATQFTVGVRRETFTRDGSRTLPTTIWYPARDGRPAPGRFPVVLFSHGLGGTPDDYTDLLRRWAAAGFVVAAPAYPKTHRGVRDIDLTDVVNQPADASYVLSRLLDGPLRGSLDAARLAAAGHSAGGITTVGLFTSSRDNRLAAGVVLAGNALGVGLNFTGPSAPLLFVHGDADGVVPYSMGRAVYERVPWPKALLTLPGQGHLVAAGTAAWTAVAATTLDFLRWTLYGDGTAKSRLPADAGTVAKLDERF
jgi:dienelactone hydrolase